MENNPHIQGYRLKHGRLPLCRNCRHVEQCVKEGGKEMDECCSSFKLRRLDDKTAAGLYMKGLFKELGKREQNRTS